MPDLVDLNRIIQQLLDRGAADGLFPGAVYRVALGGATVVEAVTGVLATMDDDGLPVASPEPMTAETMFDLASVTKVFSAHTLLSLVEGGMLGLDQPAGDVLDEYRSPAKNRVTLRHLLTHTSGLPAEWRGWHAPIVAAAAIRPSGAPPFRAWPLDDRNELIADLLGTALVAAPGQRWEYSDAGLNTAMLVAERATGRRWHELVAQHTLRPLGLHGATFAPERERAAATEYQPQYGRGVVRGTVHDEASWSLGGATANAGLFATADALLRFGEAIRLGRDWVRGEAMWNDQLGAALAARGSGSAVADAGSGFSVSLGLRIGETAWMGARGRRSRGHTGFTGTSLQVDRDAEATIVLLTNRVHPNRNGPSLHPLRAAIAEAVLG